MDSDQEQEDTPLLPNENHNGSNLKVTLVDTEGPNGITFYGTPNVQSYDSGQNNQQWHTQTSRSDTSSLVTLASDKKMSDPRRTFCLFVTFDFLITVLLWLIEIGASTSENGFFTDLSDQISNYHIDTSLFDVVMVALGRFIFLEGTYALFRIRHWWPIAVSTALCDTALILKIFAVFANLGGKHSKQTLNIPMTIVVILTDFILTWIEVWFIDFKVLPAEAKLAQRTVQAFLQKSYQGSPPVDDTMFRRHRGYGPGPQSVSDRGHYYSPAATPPASEGGFTGVESMYYSMHGYHRSSSQWSTEDTSLVQKGVDGLNQLWSMYQNTPIWKEEKRLASGDVVYSTETPEYGKSFKIDATINGISPDIIFHEIILKAEEMPVWNKTVADVKILRKIGEQTFITLEVSSPAAMGLIASREFVTVRRIEKKGDLYVSAGISTDQCDNIVPKSNFVRGVNGPTGFVVGPSESGPSSSKFVWILNTDLKGNLSRSLVNRNLTSTLIEFVAAMKRRLRVA